MPTSPTVIVVRSQVRALPVARRLARVARGGAGIDEALAAAVREGEVVVVGVPVGALAVGGPCARLARILLLEGDLLVGSWSRDGAREGQVEAEALSVAVGAHAGEQILGAGGGGLLQDLGKGNLADEAVADRCGLTLDCGRGGGARTSGSSRACCPPTPK